MIIITTNDKSKSNFYKAKIKLEEIEKYISKREDYFLDYFNQRFIDLYVDFIKTLLFADLSSIKGNDLKDKLKLQEFTKRVKNVYNFIFEFKNQLYHELKANERVDYLNPFRGNIVRIAKTKENILFLKQYCHNDLFGENELDYILDRYNNLNNMLISVFESAAKFFECLLNLFDSFDLPLHKETDIVCLNDISNGYKEYVSINGKVIQKEMNKIAQTFKVHRQNKLSSDDWGTFANVEMLSWDLAMREDDFVNNPNRQFEYLNKEERKELIRNTDILLPLKEGSYIDDELFSFDDANNNNQLINKLTSNNIDYFYNLVHRINVIKMGMFPELKQEFDKYLNPNTCNIPECLNTPEGQRIWEIVKNEGWVDENLQPIGLSRTQSALLAIRIGEVLNLQSKYAPFETLWNRSNMSSDYDKAIGQTQASKWIDKFKDKIH